MVRFLCRVNEAESDQMYRQLKANGQVVAYYLYPRGWVCAGTGSMRHILPAREGHTISGAANLLDCNLRIDNFLSKHLGGRYESYEKPEGANVRAIHDEDLPALVIPVLPVAARNLYASPETWAPPRRRPQRDKNVVIFRVPESSEDLLETVRSYFGPASSGLGQSVNRVWRQGRARQAGEPRPVIVEFTHPFYRNTALERRVSICRDHNIDMREDLSPAERASRSRAPAQPRVRVRSPRRW
jgi:hypothetical protein